MLLMSAKLRSNGRPRQQSMEVVDKWTNTAISFHVDSTFGIDSGGACHKFTSQCQGTDNGTMVSRLLQTRKGQHLQGADGAIPRKHWGILPAASHTTPPNWPPRSVSSGNWAAFPRLSVRILRSRGGSYLPNWRISRHQLPGAIRRKDNADTYYRRWAAHEPACMPRCISGPPGQLAVAAERRRDFLGTGSILSRHPAGFTTFR